MSNRLRHDRQIRRKPNGRYVAWCRRHGHADTEVIRDSFAEVMAWWCEHAQTHQPMCAVVSPFARTTEEK